MTLILLIEDEHELQEEIADILGFDGYDVITADNGKIGIKQAQSHHPDLIICDIMMPEVDGYQVLETLQQSHNTESIPFIFLTAKATTDHMREGMNLGADDYLAKPFEHRDLLLAIETRLHKSKVYQETSDLRAQEQQDQLIQHIVHEIKNPLTAMQLATSLVETYVGKDILPNLDTWLEAYQSGSNRLNHLIEQLLLETSFECGKLNRESVRKQANPNPVWTILTNAIECGRKFTRGNHDLGVQLNLAQPDTNIVCDLKLMQHALAEIIANAFDFSPTDTQLLIAQWVSDDMLNITITDKGVGMTDSQIKYALMPFAKARQIKTAKNGLGLGLSLAQRIVELHGGVLNILSATNEGTTVLVRLPYL